MWIKNILDMIKSNLLRNFFKLIKIIGGRGSVVFVFRGDNWCILLKEFYWLWKIIDDVKRVVIKFCV